MTTRPSQPAPARRAGFTLTELMISLALVLLLTLAMTRIFGVTTRAIGKGNAISEVTRGLDAVRTSLQLDFTGAEAGVGYDVYSDAQGIVPLTRQPAIIIYSTSTDAFLSREDQTADLDKDNRTLDVGNSGTETAVSPYELGRRFFRTDTFSFFAAGKFKSQADLGNGGFISSDVTSNNAWVWYGHARAYSGSGRISSSGSYQQPGAGSANSNANNYFAGDFILSRNAMLLKPPVDHDSDPATGDTVVDSSGTPIYHARARWGLASPATSNLFYELGTGAGKHYIPNLSPLMFDASSTGGTDSPVSVFKKGTNTVVGGTSSAPYDADHMSVPFDGTAYYMNADARVDVAGLDPDTFRGRVRAFQSDASNGQPAGTINGPMLLDNQTSPSRGAPVTWYERMFARSGGQTSAYRFFVNPVLLRPLDAGEASQATNLLLKGASQFTVEFAGDFVTQNAATGATTDNRPDGIIDFGLTPDSVRFTRWYGMPRDVDGNGIIPGPGAGNATAAFLRTEDVRPVADFLNNSRGMTVDTGMPFEKRLPRDFGTPKTAGRKETLGPRTGISDYVATGRAAVQQNIADSNKQSGFDWSYLAAFGPGDFDGDLYPVAAQPYDLAGLPLRPSLIRVITRGMDRQAKLEDSLAQELVFRVPAN